MFFYLNDHKGDDCTIVDSCVITSEVLHSFLLGKFLCYGLNVNTNEGQRIKLTLGVNKPPYVAVISFRRGSDPQVIGS